MASGHIFKREVQMSEKITGIYIRTSTSKQSKGFEAQRKAFIDYCNSMNI